MYKNIISLFCFSFIIQIVQKSKLERVEDGWAAYTQGPMVQFFCEPLFSLFSFSRWNLPGHIIFQIPTQPAAYTLHVDIPLSSLPPILCTWSGFLLACHLCGISTGDTCILFTLDTRCIFVIFVPSVLLLQWHQHVKRISKSISNTRRVSGYNLWTFQVTS